MSEFIEYMKDLLAIIGPLAVCAGLVWALRADVRNLYGWVKSLSEILVVIQKDLTDIKIEQARTDQRIQRIEHDLRK